MAAAIGSPCPSCGQTMQIPDRPPSRDHIKPRYALAGNRALVCLPLQYRQETKTLPAGYSFTYVKRGENWLIVDYDSSAMPPAPKIAPEGARRPYPGRS